MEHEQYIAQIILKDLYSTGLTQKEQEDLQAWVNKAEGNKEFVERLHSKSLLPMLENYLAVDEARLWKITSKKIGFHPARWKIGFWWIAAVFLVCIVSWWFLLKHTEKPSAVPLEITRTPFSILDTSALNNKAILELASGEHIVLEGKKGDVSKSELYWITQEQPGQLEYHSVQPLSFSGSSVGMHRLIVPPKARYQVRLSDGTIAMLNSGSTLRYPEVFGKESRTVVLEGEAFFDASEVKLADRKIPFVVQTGNSKVIVWGTRFNVNHYPEKDSMETTLLNGKVVVSNGVNTVAVAPGEAVAVSKQGSGISKRAVDTTAITAWCRGRLNFNGDRMVVILAKIERFYDVRFVNKGYNMADTTKITADLDETVSLRVVLQAFERGFQIHFEGDKVIYVYPAKGKK